MQIILCTLLLLSMISVHCADQQPAQFAPEENDDNFLLYDEALNDAKQAEIAALILQEQKHFQEAVRNITATAPVSGEPSQHIHDQQHFSFARALVEQEVEPAAEAYDEL